MKFPSNPTDIIYIANTNKWMIKRCVMIHEELIQMLIYIFFKKLDEN